MGIEKLLERKPRTALELSKLTKCSKTTAYARIRRLMKDGARIEKVMARRSKSGPASVVYTLVKTPAA